MRHGAHYPMPKRRVKRRDLCCYTRYLKRAPKLGQARSYARGDRSEDDRQEGSHEGRWRRQRHQAHHRAPATVLIEYKPKDDGRREEAIPWKAAAHPGGLRFPRRQEILPAGRSLAVDSP